MFDVPILVIAYHRVTETHNLFGVLRQVQPKRLYIAADGAIPQDKEDYRACLKTRCVFMPEWETELHTLYQQNHLGKSRMFQTAMNWFFEHEEEGIILFDDSMPHLDFFPFCQTLLERYRQNLQVAHIGGTNMLKREGKPANSYFFSAYPMSWGFATWKNRWEEFDLNMHNMQEVDINTLLHQYTMKKRAYKFWTRRFNLLQEDHIDIWEYPYIFHLWKSGSLCVIPNVNLVENTSFNKKRRKIKKLNRPTRSILPLAEAVPEIIQEKKADHYLFRKYYKRDFLTILFQWFNQNLLGE